MARATLFLLPSELVGWDGVRRALLEASDLTVLGEAAAPEEAVARVAAMQPDVILVASPLAGGPAHPVIAAVRRHAAEAKILVFAASYTPDELTRLSALGVDGYLVWGQLARPIITETVRAVLLDHVVVSSKGVLRTVLAALHGGAPPAAADALTPRELLVLRALEAGRTHAQIANEIGESARTVRRILEKLKLRFHTVSDLGLGRELQQRGLL